MTCLGGCSTGGIALPRDLGWYPTRVATPDSLHLRKGLRGWKASARSFDLFWAQIDVVLQQSIRGHPEDPGGPKDQFQARLLLPALHFREIAPGSITEPPCQIGKRPPSGPPQPNELLPESVDWHGGLYPGHRSPIENKSAFTPLNHEPPTPYVPPPTAGRPHRVVQHRRLGADHSERSPPLSA